MADEKEEEKKTCIQRTQVYQKAIVIGITLCVAFILAALLAYFIKTSGPTDPVTAYTDWSECRSNKTKRRNVVCNRKYCLTYVEPCVYEAASWSEWSFCSNQRGSGYRTRRWMCNDEPSSECQPIREKEACTSNDLEHLCKDGLKDPRIGDGYCDDIFNWHVCDFDGGDCCEKDGQRVSKMFCEDCFCLQNYTIKDTCYYKSRVGDGLCDDLANTEECSYDGGDCCLFTPSVNQSCTECECKYDPVEIMSKAKYFPNDTCLHKYSGAFQDGFCHDELNNAACEFDGGDCCAPTVYTDACVNCKCQDSSIKNIVKKEKGCDLMTAEELAQIEFCRDDLNTPECGYSNGKCCGKANLNFCDDCQCKDPRNKEKRDIERCKFYLLKGNGFCDDVNNIPECEFDGGDCCGNNVQHGFCTTCECWDENEKQYETTEQWSCAPEVMHDSVCNPVNKDRGCRFDGFDCEVPENCPIELLSNSVCDEAVNTEECSWDLGYCKPNSWVGNSYLCLKNESLRGDGLCDYLNNVKECDHDGGDCQSNPDSDEALVILVGRTTNPLNDIEVILPNSTKLSSFPRAPYKVDNPLSFTYQGTLYMCGGRARNSFVLNTCVSLDFKSFSGTQDDYLFWRYKASMLSPMLYSAIAMIELDGKSYIWLTGGETTNAARVNLAGAADTSMLYDIELDEWQESIELLLPIAGHCMVKLSESRILFAGGYKDNGLLSRNVFTFQFKGDQMSNGHFSQRGPMRVPRKYHSCGQFVQTIGTSVAIAVGGVDDTGNRLSSAEIYFDTNGEWLLIESLPIPIGYSSMNVINNRVLLIGGSTIDETKKQGYIYNEETGWHLSNLEMSLERLRHSSVVIKASDVSDDYPMTPNFFVAFGQDAFGSGPISEVICTSQAPDSFSRYCNTDSQFDSATGIYGATMFMLRDDIYSCGGLLNGEVIRDCYFINPTLIDWQKSETVKLSEPRMFAASTYAAQGIVISGGFIKLPTETEYIASSKVETINERVQRVEKDLSVPLAQHCIVHVNCFYYFYAGGTSSVGDIAIPSAYFHHVKTGNFHKLPPMKQSRANHVCLSEPKGANHRRIFVVGGRTWVQQDGVLVENFLTSTEIFDTQTETWTNGPDLPVPLAFATVVATPLGTFILGGQTGANDPTSTTGQILKLVSKKIGTNMYQDYWEVLPYELATPRRALGAISLNLNNYRDTPPQDCDKEFVSKYPKTFYQFTPENSEPHILVVLENQKVLDFDVSNNSLRLSEVEYEDWPSDIRYSLGGSLDNFIMILGGIGTTRTMARFRGDRGINNHEFVQMHYSHTGGAGSVVGKKFLIIGGKDLSGKIHGKAEYFDQGAWYKLDDPVLDDLKISRACLAGHKELSTAFLIGGSYGGTTTSRAWKTDFEKSPMKWTKMRSMTVQRQGHKCGIFKLRQKYYIIAAGGFSDEYYTSNSLIISSVELYDIEADKWQFTAALPKALYGGSVTVVANRLFYFGGLDSLSEASDSVLEYVPMPSGQEFQGDIQSIRSEWIEYANMSISSQFLIAVGYDL